MLLLYLQNLRDCRFATSVVRETIDPESALSERPLFLISAVRETADSRSSLKNESRKRKKIQTNLGGVQGDQKKQFNKKIRTLKSRATDPLSAWITGLS
jgi:hypothetical protein